MIKEGIQSIVDLTIQATSARVIESEIPGFYEVHEHGTVKLEASPEFRIADLESLDSLIRFVAANDICESPEVYVGHEKITVLCSAPSRLNSAHLKLYHSERFMFLEGLAGGRSFSPGDAVTAFRFALEGTGADPFILAMRHIDFSRSSDGAFSKEHGKESLGRRVEAKAQGREGVPESFKVTVPVFGAVGLREFQSDVRLGVELRPESETVYVRAFSDELQSARLNACRQIVNHLAGEFGNEIRVFQGAP